MRLTHEQFRKLAWKHGLAATPQGQVVQQTVIARPGHDSPESIPAGQVTPPASTLRLDDNLKPHHHLVCSRSKSVQDIEAEFIDYQRLSPPIPDGFDLTRSGLEVFGLHPRRARK